MCTAIRYCGQNISYSYIYTRYSQLIIVWFLENQPVVHQNNPNQIIYENRKSRMQNKQVKTYVCDANTLS